MGPTSMSMGWKRLLPAALAMACLVTMGAQKPATRAQSGAGPDPDFGHLPKVWHSETTKHDFQVEVTKDVFHAEWINLPAESAKRGAYIHTECRRTGSKWVGNSDISLLVALPDAPAGVDSKICKFNIRFEVDSVSPDKITGQGESLRSFDVATCRVNETKWAPFTWVPKK